MDSLATRKQRLALAVKNARDERDIGSAKALALLTEEAGEGVSERTIAGIEAAERTPSKTTLNKLDVAFGVPIGSLQAVLDGRATTIPSPGTQSATDSDNEPQFDVGGQAYTLAELRILAKALGPKGLYDWATTHVTGEETPGQGLG